MKEYDCNKLKRTKNNNSRNKWIYEIRWENFLILRLISDKLQPSQRISFNSQRTSASRVAKFIKGERKNVHRFRNWIRFFQYSFRRGFSKAISKYRDWIITFNIHWWIFIKVGIIFDFFQVRVWFQMI